MLTLASMAEMGYACNLKTVGESWGNIRNHHDAFTHEDLEFLVKEIDNWNLPPKLKISQWINEHNLEWYFLDKESEIFNCPILRSKQRKYNE